LGKFENLKKLLVAAPKHVGGVLINGKDNPKVKCTGTPAKNIVEKIRGNRQDPITCTNQEFLRHGQTGGRVTPKAAGRTRLDNI